MARKSTKTRKKIAPATEVAEARVAEESTLEANSEQLGDISTASQPDITASTDPADGSDLPEEALEQVAPNLAPQVDEPKARGSFMPLILGGIVAGLIGFVVGYFTFNTADDMTDSRLSAQQSEIDDLRGQIANIPPAVDLAPLQTDISDAAIRLERIQSEMATQLTTLDARVETIEKQPSSDGTLQEAAIAAYERDLEALRTRLEGQQSNLQAMADATAQQLTQTRQEAAAIEEQANKTAQSAMARAAIARIQGALENGVPLMPALNDFSGAVDGQIPPALLAVSDGAPTLGSLQTTFPDAARAGLNAARQEGAANEGQGGLTAFLRNQFEVRSVTPRDGNDTDAILSRAEAALRDGRLSDAMSEVAALPEVARAAMTDWSAQAELRAAAVHAAADLANEFNDN